MSKWKLFCVVAVVPMTCGVVTDAQPDGEEGEFDETVEAQPVYAAVSTTSSSSGAVDGDDDERTWTVAVVSDLNGTYGSTEYNEHVDGAVDWIRRDLQPDLVVSTGDMVAGQRQGLDYSAMWSSFHESVTDELARADIPLAVTPGNHDASGEPAYWRERIEYARQWELRRPQLRYVDDDFYPFHYAFEMGPALFVSLDGTEVGELDDAQLDWLDDVLERNSHLEVTVLFSHLPQYPVAEGRQQEVLGDDRLDELMDEHDVDMKISGHHHAYYPGEHDETIHLHSHCLGAGARALVGEEQPRPRSVAVFEYDDEGIRNVEARVTPEFDETIDRSELPEFIEAGDVRLRRLELSEAN